MCGIAGSVGVRETRMVHKMVSSLRHRGPDGMTCRSNGIYQTGHSRLSINDASAGSRIITDETGKVSVVCNGEIYNHRQLRAQLENTGHTFATHTDTEVIAHLYEEVGIECVHQLRGMFAFAIFDGRQLFLARDRLGIKPLYYTHISSTGEFLFASEIKALLQSPDMHPEIDFVALADSIVLGYPVGTRTFIEGIQSLAAGHTMRVAFDATEVRVGPQRPYFQRIAPRDSDATLPEAMGALGDALEESIELHMAADVEVGFTLSGGIDSTILALIAQEHNGPLHTFTVSDHEAHPDMLQAKEVAGLLGAKHLGVVMSFEDYLTAIPGSVAAAERPSSLYGLPYHILCEKIASTVRVCIHGEGADELFGGYREYLDRRYRLYGIRRRLPLLKSLGVLPSNEALAIIESLASAKDFTEYLDAIFSANLGDALERNHLDPVDKSAMAAGVEMRVPYLDDRVFGLASKIPLHLLVRADMGIKKYILRKLLLERWGIRMADVALREKLGVPSAGVRYLAQLDQMCEVLLPDDYLTRHELAGCFSKKRELLMFEMFLDVFIKHAGDATPVGSVRDYIYTRGGRQELNDTDG